MAYLGRVGGDTPFPYTGEESGTFPVDHVGRNLQQGGARARA